MAAPQQPEQQSALALHALLFCKQALHRPFRHMPLPGQLLGPTQAPAFGSQQPPPPQPWLPEPPQATQALFDELQTGAENVQATVVPWTQLPLSQTSGV